MVSIDAFSLESHWVRPVYGRMWCLNREEAGNPKREKRERREREYHFLINLFYKKLLSLKYETLK
jgi:hypothetical protein